MTTQPALTADGEMDRPELPHRQRDARSIEGKITRSNSSTTRTSNPFIRKDSAPRKTPQPARLMTVALQTNRKHGSGENKH